MLKKNMSNNWTFENDNVLYLFKRCIGEFWGVSVPKVYCTYLFPVECFSLTRVCGMFLDLSFFLCLSIHLNHFILIVTCFIIVYTRAHKTLIYTHNEFSIFFVSSLWWIFVSGTFVNCGSPVYIYICIYMHTHAHMRTHTHIHLGDLSTLIYKARLQQF